MTSIDYQNPVCPKCGDGVWRDSADVGVGVIYGPYGCGNCGWSEDPHYDRSNGESEAQKEEPNHIVDSWGGLWPRWLKHSVMKPAADEIDRLRKGAGK